MTDSLTMLRRNLVHMRRQPMTLMLAGMPVIFLALFVYVFGGTLGAGLPGVSGGRDEYLDYVTPGILLLAVASLAQGAAITVAVDMTEGIIARFRTMSISRAAVITGHVAGNALQGMLGIAIVLATALLIGFEPNASVLDWLGVLGLLALVTVAITWLAVAMGMASRTVEGASNLPMPLMLLPFLGSGFVPTETMPEGLRWFAEHQPFTPIIETLRSLLMGTPGDSALVAVAWCLGMTACAYLWARRLYERRSR